MNRINFGEHEISVQALEKTYIFSVDGKSIDVPVEYIEDLHEILGEMLGVSEPYVVCDGGCVCDCG